MTEAQRKANKRLYMDRERRGVCVSCGKPDERTRNGAARCAVCNAKAHPPKRNPMTTEQRVYDRESKREWAHMRRKAKVCVECGTQDARTLDGKQLCQRCATKRNAQQRERRKGGKERKVSQERRDKWREEGRCSSCGGPKQEPEFKMCIDCRVRAKLRKLKFKINHGWQPRGVNGRCWQCNKRKAIEGKRLCKQCYEAKLILPQCFSKNVKGVNQ